MLIVADTSALVALATCDALSLLDLRESGFSHRPNGSAELSPGLRPKADALGRKTTTTVA
jgi:hypothetical protein